MGERSVEASTSFLEEMVHRAKSLPAFNPDGWFLFLGTSVLLFEGSITLLVPLIEAVHTPEDKQKFPSMYRKVILGIVSFYAFFVCALRWRRSYLIIIGIRVEEAVIVGKAADPKS